MNKIKLLVWGDAVVPTGFSRVLHSIMDNLPQDKYDIHWLGVNYYGDPHPYPYKIYPASMRGDVYGMGRIEELVNKITPDLFFCLNDPWVLDPFIKRVSELYKGNAPKMVVYFPVDANNHNPNWYKSIANTTAVTYTKFGAAVASKACPNYQFKIIPHGINKKDFFKIEEDKSLIKGLILPNKDEFLDSFIVLSAARNQPRKRLDIGIEAFSLFAKGKPENVKLYEHTGISDQSINIIDVCKRFGIENRLIVTNLNNGPQTVPINRLNVIYNSCEVGLYTSLGEGWNLPLTEHAVTGAPQVVPNNSANPEVIGDVGLMVDTTLPYMIDQINTIGSLVKASDVAEKLELLYTDKELYNRLSKKSIEKFSRSEFQWENISLQWDKLYDSVLGDMSGGTFNSAL
jgi:glycosyltransferase involved in cell wall biosynthesis